MQGRKIVVPPFPETFDLNQISSDNNNSIEHSASWINMTTPLESAANNHSQSNGVRECGECSSSRNNMQEQALDCDSKARFTYSGTNLRSQGWSAEPSDIRRNSYIGNQVTERSQNMQNCSTIGASMNLSSNHEHLRENDHHIDLPNSLNKSGHFRTEQIKTFYASCSNMGTSSGGSSSSLENNDASGPSSSTWGSSCKRRACEGTSGHFYPVGSSNSNQPMENIMQQPVPASISVSGNLSISSSMFPTNHLEQLNSRSGGGTSRARPGHFASSSVRGFAENPAENFALRSNLGHRESVPFGTSRITSVGHSSVYAAQPQSQYISNFNTLQLMSPVMLPMNFNGALNQSLVHVNEANGAHSNTWNRAFCSPPGGSSSSFLLSGESSLGTREDANFRSSFGNSSENPVIVSAPETRNILVDQIDWSFTPRTSTTSDSRIGPSSGGQWSSTVWLPRQNQTSQDQQRLAGDDPWISFPCVESQILPYTLLPPASLSSDERATASHAQHQSQRRPAALLVGIPENNTIGWNVSAAVEGRHRLICQVSNAMRRGVHLQAEARTDSVVNGFPELHDRHRDMRLDVDNMSYEELLALEERIGNVSTGLNDEQIRGSMKLRKYKYEADASLPTMEPCRCCICQENYVGGDYIGILDCGHDFHTICVKQWLMRKNTCPICKMTAWKT